jgi:hypothetical protein
LFICLVKKLGHFEAKKIDSFTKKHVTKPVLGFGKMSLKNTLLANILIDNPDFNISVAQKLGTIDVGMNYH